MESEDKHRADRDDGDNTDFDAVETSAEVDNAKDGKEIDHVIESNMQDESAFVDMPIEESNAEEKGRETYKEIIPEVEAFQIVCMSEEIPHEEKAEAAYKSVECDIRRKMPVFVGTIEYDADNGKDDHNSLSIMNPIANVCNPVHEEKGEQEPCDTI